MLRATLVLLTLIGAAGAAAAQPLDGRLKEISDGRTVKLAYRSDSNPFSFVNGPGEPVGYSIDLCRAVVKSLTEQLKADLAITWVAVTSQTRFKAVVDGLADMECGSSSVTLSRMKEVDFSSYTFVENTGVMVKAASGLRSVNDLGGKSIGVIAGTTNEQAVARELKRRNIAAKSVQVASRQEGMAALRDGRIDGFASDKLLLSGAQGDASLVMLPEDLSFEPYALVLPRGDWAFRLAVNTALARTYRSDQILEIFTKWFSGTGARPNLLIGSIYLLGGLPE